VKDAVGVDQECAMPIGVNPQVDAGALISMTGFITFS
jgi:hypothetical protein